MKSKVIAGLVVALLIFGLAYQVKRFLFGYSVVLAELSLGPQGELMLVEEWEDWEREGNIISLWYRPASSEIWGVEQIEFWTDKPWGEGSLEYRQATNEVEVHGKNKVRVYSLDSRARSYADSGFIFDPDWQPGSW